MKCPFCKSDDNQVIDTRKYDTCIIRVRRCLNPECDMAWHTEENVQITKIERMVDVYIKLKST